MKILKFFKIVKTLQKLRCFFQWSFVSNFTEISKFFQNFENWRKLGFFACWYFVTDLNENFEIRWKFLIFCLLVLRNRFEWKFWKFFKMVKTLQKLRFFFWRAFATDFTQIYSNVLTEQFNDISLIGYNYVTENEHMQKCRLRKRCSWKIRIRNVECLNL